jgi:hypothetical protein
MLCGAWAGRKTEEQFAKNLRRILDALHRPRIQAIHGVLGIDQLEDLRL